MTPVQTGVIGTLFSRYVLMNGLSPVSLSKGQASSNPFLIDRESLGQLHRGPTVRRVDAQLKGRVFVSSLYSISSLASLPP